MLPIVCASASVSLCDLSKLETSHGNHSLHQDLNEMQDQASIEAGQAVYTPGVLAMYDFVVHLVSNHLIWRCPTQQLVELTNTHITGNHLDLGVGTGLLLDRARLPADPRIVLVELNQNCLDATARRLARYRPKCYRHNVLEPLALDSERPFDSAGLNYLLHCLPGNIPKKAAVFDHVAEYLAPGGVLFGSTLLVGGVRSNPLAQMLMWHYNRQGIFSNSEDTLSDLQTALQSCFVECGVEVVGCAALFWGRMAN
jgi:SAM-dependent methyltransferase